jgi:hypothetical protein
MGIYLTLTTEHYIRCVLPALCILQEAKRTFIEAQCHQTLLTWLNQQANVVVRICFNIFEPQCIDSTFKGTNGLNDKGRNQKTMPNGRSAICGKCKQPICSRVAEETKLPRFSVQNKSSDRIMKHFVSLDSVRLPYQQCLSYPGCYALGGDRRSVGSIWATNTSSIREKEEADLHCTLGALPPHPCQDMCMHAPQESPECNACIWYPSLYINSSVFFLTSLLQRAKHSAICFFDFPRMPIILSPCTYKQWTWHP